MRCVLAVKVSSWFDTFVDLGICVAQFDGDVAHQFVLETHSLNSDIVCGGMDPMLPWARVNREHMLKRECMLGSVHMCYGKGFPNSMLTFTPEMALTTVDLPCATWPMVPMLMVA